MPVGSEVVPQNGPNSKTDSRGVRNAETKIPILPGVHEQARGSGHPSDFDEYGAELDPEARVWRMYAEESERFDVDKVNEWHQSLDVVIISASVVYLCQNRERLTLQFLVESTKKLQNDPSVITLEVISQTLLGMARNQSDVPPSSPPPVYLESHPSWSDTCVNILWYLSLSLSVATIFVSMLAKEWCKSFLSGRTGPLYVQARRRQVRWDGIIQWHMPEVLATLPSVLPLALILFTTGLCIQLWNIRPVFALPVIVLTLGVSWVYCASTVLPLWFEHCPYRTPLSRHARTVFGNITKQNEEGTDTHTKQDIITSQALSWVIETCDNQKSIDVALQAIAGADKDLPLEPLMRCRADMLVRRRLTAGSAYPADYEVIFGLYARALMVLQPAIGPADQYESYDHAVELRKKIKILQITIERNVSSWLAAEEFLPTRYNLLALRTGNLVPLRCLHSLSYKREVEMLELLGSTIDVLEKNAFEPGLLQSAALRSLVISTATLLSCSHVHSSPAAVSPHLLRLLRADLDPAVLGILLVVIALVRDDYPGWTYPAPLNLAGRAERAIELITHYAPTLDALPRTLTSLGLLGLLLHSDGYNLGDEDLEKVSRAHSIPRMQSSNNDSIIYTFPRQFNLHQHLLDSITHKLSNPNAYYKVTAKATTTKAHLLALWYIDGRPTSAPSPEIYVFVVESICRSSPGIARSRGLELIKRYPPHNITHNLVLLVDNRNILPLLANLLSDGNGDGDLRDFAAAQLCSVVEFVLQNERTHSDIASLLLVALIQCKGLWQPLSAPPEFPMPLSSALPKLHRYLKGETGGHPSPALPTEVPVAEVYVAVVKNVCQTPPTAISAVHRRLMSRVLSPELSDQLANLVNRHSIIPLLVRTLESVEGDLYDFAVSQLCVLVGLATVNPSGSTQDFSPLLYVLTKHAELWDLQHIPPVLNKSLLGLRQFIIDSITVKLSPRGGELSECTDMNIQALHRTYSQSIGPPTPQIYVLVTEKVCQSSVVDTRSMGIDLVSRFPTPERSNDLIELINNRNIISILNDALRSNNPGVKAFATNQLCLFIEFVLESPCELGSACERLAINLIECRQLCNPNPLMEWPAPLMRALTRFHLHVIEATVDGPAKYLHITSAESQLDALCRTYHRSLGTPTPQVHMFLLENVLRDPSATMKRLAGMLFCRFPYPALSDNFIALIVRRNIELMSYEANSEDRELRLLVSAHSYLLIKIILERPEPLGAPLKTWLAGFWKCEESDLSQQLASTKEHLRKQIVEMCGVPFDSKTGYYIHLYARRIVEYERSS